MSAVAYFSRRSAVLLTLAAAGLAACNEPAPTGWLDSEVALAKGAGGGGGGGATPVITATDPASAPPNVRLNVHVLGSNFDDGSSVRFLLDRKSVSTVTVHSTQFVSANELVADVSISIDAVADLYDVEVTAAGGKKGIGIEQFAITGAVPFQILLGADDGVPGSGDILAQDGGGANAGCPTTLYCDAVDFVGAHLNGANGHLMFWTSQYTTSQEPVRQVRIDADGDAFGFHGFTADRIYTNTNDPAVDLRYLGESGNPNSVTSRLFVETEIGYLLRFGTDCAGGDRPATRVTVSRSADVWTITPLGGAYLCFTTGAGRKATTSQAVVANAAFTMTMTRIP